VTGAAGFLGSHLCDALLACGADVYGVSRAERDVCGGRVGWLRSDLDNEEQIERVLRAVRPDIVYHLAGHVTAAPEIEHVRPTFSSLLASTVHLLQHATELGCRRIVLVGSSTEPSAPGATPLSPYAAAKASATAYARMFHALYATPVVVARTTMAYGPRQSPSKLIPSVVLPLLRGAAPRLSSGTMAADWIYVDDVAAGLVAAAAAPDAVGTEVDLGTGTQTSVREMVERVVDLMRPSVRPVFGALPDRPWEATRTADVKRTWTLLGWRANTALTTGLERTIAWYRDTRPASAERQ
jgi:UDP-glucose 4-epimerase